MNELIGGGRCRKRRSSCSKKRSSCSKKRYSCPKKCSCYRRRRRSSSYGTKKGPSFCAGKTFAGCGAYPSCTWTAKGCRAKPFQGERVYTEVPMVFAPPEYTPDKVAETQKFLADLEAKRAATTPIGGKRRKSKSKSKRKSRKSKRKSRKSKRRSRH